MEFQVLASEKRFSCRSFEQRPIEKGDLDKILEAGRIAPTAGNFQPQRIIVINTPEGMKKLAQCTHYTYGAPAALVACYDSNTVWVRNYDGKNSGDVDVSIVTTQMMLQAAELGIGTCWIGHFDPVRIRELFQIPESIVPVAILDIGYPGEKGKPHPVHWKRKELDETVVYETF